MKLEATMSRSSKAGFSGVKTHKLKGKTKATPEERKKSEGTGKAGREVRW